jgi:hypothetical protein
MAENNLKKLAEMEYSISPAMKHKIRNNVQTRLNLIKFFGNVFDLYVSNAGVVMSEMLGGSENDESRYTEEEDEDEEWQRENQGY